MKKALSLLLSVLLIFGVAVMPAGAASVNDFTDLNTGAWYFKAVDYAVSNNLFYGTSAATFSPDTPMNRGMFVTVLGRYGNISPVYTSQNSFTDLDMNAYYHPYACWASDIGVLFGVSSTQFAPEDSITREQLAVMLYRFAAKSGYDVAFTADKYNTFSDTGSVSNYAVEALQWATTNSIVNGSGGKLDPQGLATRAQVAQMVFTFNTFVSGGGTVTEPENPGTVDPTDPEPENPGTDPSEGYDPQYVRKTGRSDEDANGGYYDYDLANEVMDLIDELRESYGRQPLLYQPTIQEWTDIRAKEYEFICANATGEITTEMAHTRPDGSNCLTVGYRYSLGAENLLRGNDYSSYKKEHIKEYASEVVTSWYNSEGHRNSMLNPTFILGTVSCYVKGNNIYVAHLFSYRTLWSFDQMS